MRSVLISVLDALLILSWLSTCATVLFLASLLLSGIIPSITAVRPERYGAAVGLVTSLLWVTLGTSMLLHAVWTQPHDEPMRKRWIWAVVLNPLLVGPSAYYLLSFRQNANGRAQLLRQISTQQLTATRFLHYLSSSAVAAFVLSIGVLFLSGENILMARIAAAMMVISLPVVALSTLGFATLLLIDAFSRSEAEWQETNFLKFLNSWAWVFGAHYYYTNFVRSRSDGQI